MKKVICIILAIMALLLIAMWLKGSDKRHNERIWHEGECEICGGHYKYVDTEYHRDGEAYVYRCDGCGHKIKMTMYHLDLD